MRLIDADKLHPDRLTDMGLAISQSQIANAEAIDKDKLVEIICEAVMSEIGADHNQGYDVADKVIDEIDKLLVR